MNEAKLTKLLDFDTPTVSNGLGLLGVRDNSYGHTGPDVRALMPDMGRRVGVAVTARIDTTSPGEEGNTSLFGDWLRLMVEARDSGDGEPVPVFAVIESVGLRPRHTVTIGDGMGTQMRMAGAVAYLTNGSIRDLQGVRDVPLPCWVAGTLTHAWRAQMARRGVHRGGRRDDGQAWGCPARRRDRVIAIPAEVAGRVYDKAVAVNERESAMFAKLQAPGMTIEKHLGIE